MDEDITDLLRKVVATQMAHRFMIQQMLALAFFELAKPNRLKFAEAILDASIRTDQYDGLAKGNDLMAANLSEAVIHFQEQVDQIVGIALSQVEEGEIAGAAEFYRKRQNPPFT